MKDFKKALERDIALESAQINEAVRLLPEGHNWGSVRILSHAGDAICIDCGMCIQMRVHDGKPVWTGPTWWGKESDSNWDEGYVSDECNYCNYCTCSDCKTGWDESGIKMKRAQTENGDFICQTCYAYECCLDAGSHPDKGLCKERKCDHRPKLVSEWQ